MKIRPRAVRVMLTVTVLLLCLSSAALAETETETQTTDTVSGTQYLRFAMVPSPVSQPGYPAGNGSVEIQAEGNLVAVHFYAEGVAKGAHLTLVLLANGTSYSVANMTTSYDGQVESEATVTLAAGSYSVGFQVYDSSSFSSPTVVLVSSPTTQTLSLTSSSQASSTTTESETQFVSTVQEGETEDGYIKSAIQTKMIPAVVEVGDGGSTTQVNDGNFSVSVGGYQQDGYLVSISAVNVTGPRVLLVNLTSTQARSLFSGRLMVTLDGSVLPQTSALSQVLSAGAGVSAKYVVVSGPSALKLLILIPHFSYHSIAILPILANAGAELLYYAPALLLSVAAVTVVVVAVYSRRTRVGI